MTTTITDLVRMHGEIAKQLDASVPNQNDFRFALLGVCVEVGEALQCLPWRPWRAADDRQPTEKDLSEALPELADAMGALLRAVANLGIAPEVFEYACVEHITIKYQRITNGMDR